MSHATDPRSARFGAGDQRGQSTSEGIGLLFADLLKDLQRLVRGEVALARAEIQEDAGRIGRGVASMAVAAIIGLTGFIFLMLGATYVLNLWVRMWIAAAIVGVVLLLIGAILAMNAKSKLSAGGLAPDQTIDSVKETQEWAKQQINSATK
jgi:hypothetical protein